MGKYSSVGGTAQKTQKSSAEAGCLVCGELIRFPVPAFRVDAANKPFVRGRGPRAQDGHEVRTLEAREVRTDLLHRVHRARCGIREKPPPNERENACRRSEAFRFPTTTFVGRAFFFPFPSQASIDSAAAAAVSRQGLSGVQDCGWVLVSIIRIE